jgi:DNA polymerase-3 subunit delta
MSEGATPVGVLRAGLMHLQRLVRVRIAVEDGVSVDQAVRSARPPVFYRREASFGRAVRLWSLSALEQGSVRLWETERGCKSTGAPAEAMSRSAILGLAQRAAVMRRRG